MRSASGLEARRAAFGADFFAPTYLALRSALTFGAAFFGVAIFGAAFFGAAFFGAAFFGAAFFGAAFFARLVAVVFVFGLDMTRC